MAVQIVAYELFRARGVQHRGRAGGRSALADPLEMERLYAHLAQVLEEIDFRDRTQGGTHLMARLRRFFQRAALDRNEVNILRGILTAVQSRRRRAGAPTGAAVSARRAGLPRLCRDHAGGSGRGRGDGPLRSPAEGIGNPSSSAHAFGRRAAERIERGARRRSRRSSARAAGEIVFTSGATESDNLGDPRCGARANAHRGRHIVSSRIEHKAVLDPVQQLRRKASRVTLLSPDRSGRIDPAGRGRGAAPGHGAGVDHARQQRDRGHPGYRRDRRALPRARRAVPHRCGAGGRQDAARCRMRCRWTSCRITAHKLYGPKGVGALYVRAAARGRTCSRSSSAAARRGGCAPGRCPPTRSRASAWPASSRAGRLDRRARAAHAACGSGCGGPRDARAACTSTARERRACRASSMSSFEGVEGESLVRGCASWRFPRDRPAIRRPPSRPTCCAPSAGSTQLGRELAALQLRALQRAGATSTWPADAHPPRRSRLRALSPASEPSGGRPGGQRGLARPARRRAATQVEGEAGRRAGGLGPVHGSTSTTAS